MQESGKTRGWFAVGIGLIIAGGAIYGLLILLGIGFAINQSSKRRSRRAHLGGATDSGTCRARLSRASGKSNCRSSKQCRR